MPNLLSPDQVTQIRSAMRDIADTFAFPITIRRTTFTPGAFASDPVIEDFALTAIRDFGSATGGGKDQFRNTLGPAGAHEYDLYVGWDLANEAGLIGTDSRPLLDHNDLVIMEGETYEILAFGGVADMTSEPSFLQIRIKRRFASPEGAAA